MRPPVNVENASAGVFLKQVTDPVEIGGTTFNALPVCCWMFVVWFAGCRRRCSLGFGRNAAIRGPRISQASSSSRCTPGNIDAVDDHVVELHLRAVSSRCDSLPLSRLRLIRRMTRLRRFFARSCCFNIMSASSTASISSRCSIPP